MSKRFSTSPALNLRIADSPSRRRWLLLFGLLGAVHLGGIAWTLESPWPLLALPVFFTYLWQTLRDPLVGVELRWRAGRWSLGSCDDGDGIEMTPERWHLLPWVTYLAWRDGAGARGQAWLFADSASAQALRRLRVRLALQR
ncbi:hypothetical protein E4634_05495 [Mangrovimicrobium sediminis]|uniref:Toxin CptA n=1 Tax=Mangrovimicrobium sediminis TaxID=2562682 RepID=A0A4Z0M5S3_9GAMM|nr:protein YgfX [Haliea sp. SAOS-164]TGD74655.1 hypothetical protein E4634_05495 [Haliea sp. SAOS-164]